METESLSASIVTIPPASLAIELVKVVVEKEAPACGFVPAAANKTAYFILRVSCEGPASGGADDESDDGSVRLAWRVKTRYRDFVAVSSAVVGRRCCGALTPPQLRDECCGAGISWPTLPPRHSLADYLSGSNSRAFLMRRWSGLARFLEGIFGCLDTDPAPIDAFLRFGEHPIGRDAVRLGAVPFVRSSLPNYEIEVVEKRAGDRDR